MLRTSAWLASVGVVGLFSIGCQPAPAGFVLNFPDDAAKMEAQGATIQVLVPGASDPCPTYLSSPPPAPPAGDIVKEATVSLMNGEIRAGAGKITKIPTGFETVVVSVQNTSNRIFLRACLRDNIKGDKSYTLDLQRVGQAPDMASPDDMAVPPDISPDMVPPPDLTALKTLVVTVTEMRAPTRKIANAAVTVTDSASMSVDGVGDANGIVRVSTAGLTPPFRVSVQGAGDNGFAGFVTLEGLNPTFTNDQAAFTVPLELDPPATAAGNTIGVTVTDETGPYDIYYLGTNEIASDIKTTTGNAATEASITDLAAAGQYRVAVVDRAPTTRIWTTAAQSVAVGSSNTAATAQFVAASKALSIGVKKGSASFTANTYSAFVMIPASTTQAEVPLVVPTAFTADGSQSVNVVAMATQVQASAAVYTELKAVGTDVMSITRHNLGGTTPNTDTYAAGVLDPPTVGDLSAVTAATTAFEISATPPAALQLSTAYLHVHITDATGKVHAHLLAPATSPTVVHVPAILTAGTYTIDVDYVRNFMIPGGTIAATLADDWARLARPIPEQVARRTVSVTLN